MMKWIHMIGHFLILSSFYFIGVWIQQTLNLFIPGSIIGMLLLFIMLVTKLLPVRLIETGSAYILRHMPLLFIPVTVGILQFLDVFAGKGLLIIGVNVVSTVIVLLTTGAISQSLSKQKEVDRAA
ncbi:CidA/LrgA family protein [bacterium LRH843]|nr:CidA/LrgA family protein [bacterium LRH843]